MNPTQEQITKSREIIIDVCADALIGATFGVLVYFHLWACLTAFSVFFLIRRGKI